MHSHSFFHTQIQGQPKQKKVKIFISFPFEDDGMFSNVSYLEDEDKYQHDLDIEIEPQEDLDPNPAPIPKQRNKWAQNLIGNVVGDSDDIRRTRSQYQNEHVTLSHSVSLPLERCSKIP